MMLEVRPYVGAADLALVADLLRAVSPRTPHLLDYPWRLSSPAVETGRDAALCLDAAGRALGLALWQPPWAALDLFLRQGGEHDDAATALFAWAAARFRDLDGGRGRPLPYWIEVREGDEARIAFVARHGYTLDNAYGYDTRHCDLDVAPMRAESPPGFSIRPLGGVGEVDAYVRLHRRTFESDTMTAGWRARTLRHPGYRAALDLVAAAPDGRLVGFGVGWLDPERQVAQIEPFGIDPDFRGRGLGRALLLELLRRCREHGARALFVEHTRDNRAAQRAYAAVGFRPAGGMLRKGRWATEPTG